MNILLSVSFNMCFGAQKNSLIETVLLSTHNIRFGREKRKLVFLIIHSYLEACYCYLFIMLLKNIFMLISLQHDICNLLKCKKKSTIKQVVFFCSLEIFCMKKIQVFALVKIVKGNRVNLKAVICHVKVTVCYYHY